MGNSPARAVDVGSVIAGTYTIEGLIGKGGMGAVYLASHARLPGKKVAIKILHPDIADAEALARFRREAEIASRLGHPNIVEVHDWNQLEDGTPYLVLELLQGEALSDHLRRGPMPLDDVYAVVRQVGSALAAAHREGIVHRDLKPQNIFLLPTEDGTIKAKVLDFGISKIRGSTTVKTQEASLLGTPQYMAPEQATGQHSQIDGRTDVFALGAVVYEMITGKPVFRGETIPEVVFKVVYEPAPSLADTMPGTPAHVVDAVARALAKKADERWPDVATFIEALTRSPLTTARRAVGTSGLPAVGPVTGRSASGLDATARSSTGPRRVGEDAFAATVGSGDHGAALADSARAALAAGPAATVAPAPAGRSRKGLWLGLGAVAIAGGAIAAVLVAGGGSGKGEAGAAGPGSNGPGTGSGPGTAAVALGNGSIDAAPVTPPLDAAEPALVVDAPVAPPLDAGLTPPRPVDAGVVSKPATVDAGPRPPRVDAGAAAPPDDPDPGEPAVAAALVEAKAALGGGDPEGALRIIKKALKDNPRAGALWLLRARAECAMGDREAATASLQRVNKPRLAKQILARCGGE